MADNVAVTPGAGATIGLDDIGGVHYQRVKLIIGADGTNDGDVASGNPLPVTGTLAITHAALTELAAAINSSVLDINIAASAATVAVSGTFWQATQPVSGTVAVTGVSTAAKQDTAQTALDAIKTAVEILDNTVAGTELQVDVLTLPAVTGTVTANAGTNLNTSLLALEAGGNLAAAVTALQIIDNIVSGSEAQVDIVAALPAGDNNIGNVDIVSGTITTVTTVTTVASVTAIANALPAGTNLLGRVSASDETSTIYNATTALTPKFAIIDAALSGDNTLVAAVNPKKLRVHQLFLIATAAVNARFESGAGGTALSGVMNLAANGGFVLPYSPVGWFETASNTLLNLELSGAVSVDGALVYTEV